ncbi:MAG: hypothetical protein K8T89_18535 [Planctomycetes bacterium]|nr:hypothetical protein [Planctomycetota bacterium]
MRKMASYGFAFAAVFYALFGDRSLLFSADPPMLASIHDNELFYLRLDRVLNGDGFYQLVAQPLAKGADNSRQKAKYEFLLNGYGIADRLPVRWRIRDGILWMLGGGVMTGVLEVKRIPLDELPMFDKNNPKAEDLMWSKYKQHGHEYFGWGLSLATRDLNIMFENKRPMRGKFETDTEWHFAIATKVAFCDSLPTSSASESTFVLYKGKCEVWDSVRMWPKNFDQKKYVQWNMRWYDKPQETFHLGFTEPFTVFSSNHTYFFVTNSCKLYTAGKVGGKWEVVKTWAEDDRPICAVITDAETNRSFAFAQGYNRADGSRAKDVYFELNAKLTPIEFDLSKIKLIKGEEPLPMLRQLTQVLINDKKVKIAKPKVP